MDTLWDMDIQIMGVRMKHGPTGYGTLEPVPCQVQGGKFVHVWPLDYAVTQTISLQWK
jgi:hypothetical protein